MDSKLRRLAKAVTWQISGFILMTGIGFVMTGSISTGGAFALLTCAIGFVSFFLHETIWDHVRWGRSAG